MITKAQVFDIICNDVCGMCRTNLHIDSDIMCSMHKKRCYEAYDRQADKIMELIENDNRA